MATYAELAKRNDSEKIVAAKISFIQTISASKVSVHSGTTYKVTVDKKYAESYHLFEDADLINLTTGTNKDSLSDLQCIWENGLLYFRYDDYASNIVVVKRALRVATSYLYKRKEMYTGDYVVYEPRISGVPNFQQNIDVIDNNTTILGSYSLSLQNIDREYDELVNKNFFKNQAVDIYSIINPAEIDDSEILKLASGYIEEIEIDEGNLKIKISESNPLKNGIKRPIVRDDNSSIPYGFVKKQAWSYDDEADPTPDYIYTGLTVTFVSNITYGSYYYNTSIPLDLLRLSLPGTRVAMGALATTTPSTILKGITKIAGSSDEIYTTIPVFPGLAGTLKLYVHKEDYQPHWTELQLTDRYVGNDLYDGVHGRDDILSNVTATFAVGDTYAVLEQNWSFLEEGDKVYLRSIGGGEDIQLRVDYFDEATRRLYFKDKLPIAIATTGGAYFKFKKLSKITIKDVGDYTNDQFRFSLTPGGYTTIPNSGESAYFYVKTNVYNAADISVWNGGGDYLIWLKRGSSTIPAYNTQAEFVLQVNIAEGDDNLVVLEKIRAAMRASAPISAGLIPIQSNEDPSLLYIAVKNPNYFLPDTGVKNCSWAIYVDSQTTNKNPFKMTYTRGGGEEHIKCVLDPKALATGKVSIGGGVAVRTYGATANKESRKLYNSNFAGLEVGDYIYFGSEMNLITEIESETVIYVDRYLSILTFNPEPNWVAYRRVELNKDLELFYSGVVTEPHYSDVIKDVLNNAYSIPDSAIDTTALTNIKNNYSFLFVGGTIEKEDNEMFKFINKLNSSTSLITYTKRNGQISFKFIDFTNLGAATNTVDKFATLSYKRRVIDGVKQKVIYNYNYNAETQAYDKVEEYTNPNSALVAIGDLREVVEIESALIYEANTVSNEDYVKAKYFKQIEEITILGKINLSQYALGDLIKLNNFPEFDKNETYIITSVKTDGFNSELVVMRFLEQF